MANKTLLAQIKQRSDTATNWTTADPVIGDGEIIIVETSAGEKRFKVGDGEKTFTQLPYADENILSKIKNYTAGDGISISNEGVISSTGGSGSSDVYILQPIIDDNGDITGMSKTFNETKQVIADKKVIGLFNAGGLNDFVLCTWTYYQAITDDDNSTIEQIFLMLNLATTFIWVKDQAGKETYAVVQTEIPQWVSDSPSLSNSGMVYWNSNDKGFQIKEEAENEVCVLSVISQASIKEAYNAFAKERKGLYILMNNGSQMVPVVKVELNDGAESYETASSITFKFYMGGNYNIVTYGNLNTGTTPTRMEFSSYPIPHKAGNGISISNDGTISVTASKIYSGTSNAPSADLGENGDIYIQTEG